jgi:hypothetical protein
MRSVLLAAALGAGACWTGAEPVAVSPMAASVKPGLSPIDLRVKLERPGLCFGPCPTFAVEIDGSGRVQWPADPQATAKGRTAKVTRSEVQELSRRLDSSRFFERNEFGELPQKPDCQKVGSTTTCSFGASISICSHTTHTIITATRGGHTHRIDNDHCNESPELDDLEAYIDQIVGTEAP